MTPFVSVIIPTFNRAHCIERAVRCAQRQVGVEVEIIIVDDASTDNTPELLAELQKLDPRIHLVRHAKNQGVSAARNTGIAQAKGDFIAFLDSDDRWHYHKLWAQYVWLQDNAKKIENSFCLSYFTNECADGSGTVYNRFVIDTQQNAWGGFLHVQHYAANDLERELATLRFGCGAGSTLFAHYEAIKANGDFALGVGYGEDMEYVARHILRGSETHVIPEFLMIYARPDDDKIYPGQAVYARMMADKYTCAISRRYGALEAAAFVRRLRAEHRILAAPREGWNAATFALARVSVNAPCRNNPCALSGKTCQPVTAPFAALQPTG